MIRRWLAAGTALALMTGVAVAETPQQMSSDAWVRTLQSSLNRNGASLTVDGIIGPKTTAAIKQFQRSQGLRATGDADWPTRSALNTAVGSSGGNAVGGSTPPTPPARGATGCPPRSQGNPAVRSCPTGAETAARNDATPIGVERSIDRRRFGASRSRPAASAFACFALS